MTCLEIVLTYILMLNPSWTEGKAMKYADPICKESKRRDVDPGIVVSIIQHESNWSTRVKNVNRNGSIDYGLMQFNCSAVAENWRERLCRNPKRLMSIRGGIYAGVLELYYKRKGCNIKHIMTKGEKESKVSSRKRRKKKGFFLHQLNECRDCAKVAESPKKYKSSKYYSALFDILKNAKSVKMNHWWVQHYNFNSGEYSLRVLYIYMVLHRGLSGNYLAIKRRFYAHTKDLKGCIEKHDMCLKEFEEWQARRNSKRRSRSSKRRSRTSN